MASEVSISNALKQQSKTSAASSKLAEDFTQFLTLLTVQLQHQDPLSPMDTTEFTNQLVAFTGVEQQINTNQKLDALVAMQLSSALGSAQSYVGSTISYLSTEFDYAGTPTTIKYSLEKAAAISKINITNEAGEVVYSEDASKLTGVQTFTWNGIMKNGQRAPAGTYEVRVDALDADDRVIKSTTVVTGKVRGTESQDGQIFLLVGNRAVPMSGVLNTSKASANSNAEGVTMALNYVGLDITYPHNGIDYSGSGSVPIQYTLPKAADRAKVIVMDENGNTVFMSDCAKSKGSHTFSWNGLKSDGTPAPAGDYTFKIDAIGSDDRRIEATSSGKSRVTGVETIAGEIYLKTASGDTIPLADVLSAMQPDEEDA